MATAPRIPAPLAVRLVGVNVTAAKVFIAAAVAAYLTSVECPLQLSSWRGLSLASRLAPRYVGVAIPVMVWSIINLATRLEEGCRLAVPTAVVLEEEEA